MIFIWLKVNKEGERNGSFGPSKKEVKSSNLVIGETRKNEKIAKASVLLMVCLALLIPVSTAFASVPPNFTVSSYFTGSNVSRIGYCSTGIISPGASYRAAVKCELQHNDGTRIAYSAVTGTYGGPGVSTHVHNVSDTGRIVLWSTHDMWVGVVDSVEYRVVESLQ